MAIFSDDFSTRSGTADVNSPAAIAGWTGKFETGSSGLQSAAIVTDAAAIGGKKLRLLDTGWGTNLDMYPTSIGAIANGTATEVLVAWRVGAGLTISATVNYAPGFLRQSTTLFARRFQVGLTMAGAAYSQRLWYVQDADEWTAVGAGKDISASFVAGDLWWNRIQVDADGTWRWRSWKNGAGEPGSWQNADAIDTTLTGGYAGVAVYSNVNWPLDIEWFSIGTAGSAAPSPGGSGAVTFAGKRKLLLGVG